MCAAEVTLSLQRNLGCDLPRAEVFLALKSRLKGGASVRLNSGSGAKFKAQVDRVHSSHKIPIAIAIASVNVASYKYKAWVFLFSHTVQTGLGNRMAQAHHRGKSWFFWKKFAAK